MREFKKVRVFIPILFLLLIAALVLGYKKYSTNKFNAFVDSLNAQKVQSEENYTNVANSINTLGAHITLAENSLDSSSLKSSDLKNEVKKTQQYIDVACSKKNKDITSSNISSKVSHLWITSDQKKYIDDSKKALKSLEATDLSNTGACSDGRLVLDFYDSFVALLPGLIILGQLNTQNHAPTAQQMDQLKLYTTKSLLTNEGELQKALPQSVAAINTGNNLLADAYYALVAAQNGQSDDATKYSNEIDRLAKEFSNQGNGSDKEIKAHDDRVNGAGVNAAKQELALIDYQKNQNSSFSSRLAYSFPVFWLIDSKISLYSDKNNDKYPAADSVKSLVSVLKDKDLNQVNSRNLLDSVTYTSLGRNYSGFELTTTLPGGKVLIEKLSPSTN